MYSTRASWRPRAGRSRRTVLRGLRGAEVHEFGGAGAKAGRAVRTNQPWKCWSSVVRAAGRLPGGRESNTQRARTARGCRRGRAAAPALPGHVLHGVDGALDAPYRVAVREVAGDEGLEVVGADHLVAQRGDVPLDGAASPVADAQAPPGRGDGGVEAAGPRLQKHQVRRGGRSGPGGASTRATDGGRRPLPGPASRWARDSPAAPAPTIATSASTLHHPPRSRFVRIRTAGCFRPCARADPGHSDVRRRARPGRHAPVVRRTGTMRVPTRGRHRMLPTGAKRHRAAMRSCARRPVRPDPPSGCGPSA